MAAAAPKRPRGVTVRRDGVWEKKTPHYTLADVQQVVALHGAAAFGGNATIGYVDMGLNAVQAVGVIAGLKAEHFFKSMTAENDTTKTRWQDVYRAPTPMGMAYLKFFYFESRDRSGKLTPRIVVSFKRL